VVSVHLSLSHKPVVKPSFQCIVCFTQKLFEPFDNLLN